MKRTKSEIKVEKTVEMRGGKGEITLRSILNGEEEMHGKGRLFKHITIPVGASIGHHVHENESETYYIMQGSGRYDDDGTTLDFAAGDMLFDAPGQGHSIENTGDVPVEMIALILYA
ncbi:cupin domain-containing protein [Clostridia bacterium OttesenSCG-928-O13]|nr:cupin domain-containing protein [Clostridia bacterium OttesenSCG-928-O13]